MDRVRNKEEIEVGEKETVGQLKRFVIERFHLPPNVLPCVDEENPSKRILLLEYAGALLEDSWRFTDLGIAYGATIRARIIEVSIQRFRRNFGNFACLSEYSN